MNNEYPSYVQALEAWHPVRVYYEENSYLKKIVHDFSQADPLKDLPLFINLFNQVSEVDKRYTRKENQLFPYLEKRGWKGPSQGMWAFHDGNRDIIRNIRKKLENKSYDSDLSGLRDILISEMERMMSVEEFRLFPYSMELLTVDDWKEMAQGEDEIGWIHMKNNNSAVKERSPTDSSPEKINLEVGAMTPEQVNLMLKFMPIDLTYVDENDRVVFYNRGEERVFPRSPGVIGREVRFCHPPKSVDTVLRILESFKNGSKNEAEFWINFRGKVVHIRYFAIRDKENHYKGVIELSQDITHIQKLTGEQRLLNWE